MYKFLSIVMHNIIYIFKVFQILILLYLLLFVIYYFLEIILSPYAGYLDFMYATPINLTENLLNSFNIKISPMYFMLRPVTLISLILTFVAALLYNFIFFPLDNVLEFFIDKSYTNSEKNI